MTTPASFFGLSTNVVGVPHQPSVPYSGLRLWDTGTTWKDLETASGTYNWTPLTNWLAEAQRTGKTVLYTLGKVPTWAGGGTGNNAPPSDITTGNSQWKAFITALMNKSLASATAKISYVELWNEPDLKTYWTGTPGQLVQMALDAIAIIRALDPTVIIVGPSPSTANQFGVHFLPSYYAAAGVNVNTAAGDVQGCHAYVYNGSVYAPTPINILTSISQLKTLQATYKISKPIWFTEGNWGNTQDALLNDTQKVSYVGQEYLYMLSQGVQRYYWYAWDNTKGFGPLWNSTSGILPAGNAYALLNSWLVGCTLTGPLTNNAAGTYTLPITLSSGDPAQIVWNVNGPVTFSTAFLNAYQLDGTQPTITSGQVQVGTVPVLLTGTTPPVCTTPIITPGTGTYSSSQSVNMSCATSGASIFYTTDGTTPTPSSTPYTGAFSVSSTSTVKAVATASGFSTSLVASAILTITVAPPPQVDEPSLSPPTGTYSVAQTVTITCDTPASSIFYSIDTPATPASTPYTGPFLVSSSAVVNAIATASGMLDSPQNSVVITIQTAPPAPPATVGTVVWGKFVGDNMVDAFDNPLNLDILQVIGAGGVIVWNLDSNGVASFNPIAPSSGSVLGGLPGKTFAAATGPNRNQQDVFQLVTPGDVVIFGVTYLGVSYGNAIHIITVG